MVAGVYMRTEVAEIRDVKRTFRQDGDFDFSGQELTQWSELVQ